MAKSEKNQLAPINKFEIEALPAMNIALNTADDVRAVIQSMKINALNNYVALTKIESTGAYTLLGHETIQDFVKTELRGIVSYSNAMGFLDYVHEKTEGEQLDDQTIAGLLGIFSEEKKDDKKKDKSKDKEKEKIRNLNKALESKEIEIEQKEAELENLKNQLDELSREKGIDPDRYMLSKSEDSMRVYLDKQRTNAISSINALKDLDPEVLKLVSYGEVKLTIAAINQALGEVYKQYEQFFHSEDLLSKLGE